MGFYFSKRLPLSAWLLVHEGGRWTHNHLSEYFSNYIKFCHRTLTLAILGVHFKFYSIFKFFNLNVPKSVVDSSTTICDNLWWLEWSRASVKRSKTFMERSILRYIKRFLFLDIPLLLNHHSPPSTIVYFPFINEKIKAQKYGSR